MTPADTPLVRTALPLAACLLVAACASPTSDGPATADAHGAPAAADGASADPAPPADSPLTMEMPTPAAATEQHRWLRQLVGEWTVTFEVPSPDGGTMPMETTETVRAIGDLWVQAESHAEVDGTPFSSVMTIGYDPARGEFVGTWIDTVQAILWVYRGWLDDDGTTLVLEAEGPTFDGSGGTTLYRDAITIEGPDRKVLTSSMRGEDGTFTPFMSSEYERVR